MTFVFRAGRDRPPITAIVEGKPVRDTDSTADRCDREAVPSHRFPSPREGPSFHDEDPWHSFPWPGFFVMGSLDVPTVCSNRSHLGRLDATDLRGMQARTAAPPVHRDVINLDARSASSSSTPR